MRQGPSDIFSALIFKIVSDRHVGKLAFARVYSGSVKAGSYIYNATKGKKERVGRLVKMHANRREEIDEVNAGDIAAFIGLKDVGTGDTICSENQPLLLESIDFPEPVIQIAIEPRTQSDQNKISDALAKISAEDPTFKMIYNKETGQTLLAGMGELHLEIITDRLAKEYHVDINIGQPEVAYKETITRSAEHVTRYVKQTGGKGQFAHVVLKVEPVEGYEFVNKIVGGAIPREYIPAVEAGVKQALEEGVLKGYPVVNVKVTLLDGSFHEVDSSEDGIQNGGYICYERVPEESQSQTHGTGDAGGSHLARRIYRQYYQQYQQSQRKAGFDGIGEQYSGNQGICTFSRNVWILHRLEIKYAGPSCIFHGVFPL